MSHIFLYGPSGAGKTSTGKVLAHNLTLPFIDLDQEIETKACMPIGRIMELQGEPAFRDLEEELLKTVITRAESVIALGGGTLLRKENRKLAEDTGTVLFLTAEPGTLLGRLKSDPNGRPLLSGDLDRQLPTLLANRTGHYNSFPMRIQTDDLTKEQSAQQIQIALGRFHISGMGEYDVLVQDNSLGRIGELLLRHGLKNPFVVTDENVGKLHAAQVITSLQTSGFTPTLLVIPAGETHKTLDTVCSLWQGFLENGLDRSGTVIALGGGLVSDLAGFAASTYMRGANWVVVPTTLLAMADACLGGKTGFDLPEGKNLIGTFYPPRFVLVDPQVLKTLPEAEILSGLAEVVKHGVITDPSLFDLCDHGLENVRIHLSEIITRAMAVKIRMIEDDPYESGIRAVLNLGHTVGHALELVSGFRIKHGEAVAIGMVVESRLAERLSLAEVGLSKKLTATLTALNLPTRIPEELPRDELLRAMRMDKKRSNRTVRFALPMEIGRVELVPVDDLNLVLEEE